MPLPIPLPAMSLPTGAEEVLAMLEVRDSEALPAWLGQRLSARDAGARVRVLRVHPARAARIKSAAAFEAFAVTDSGEDKPVPVGDDALLAGVIRSRSPAVARGAGEPRRLIPFAAAGQVRQVLEVRGCAAGHEAEDLVAVACKYYERLVEGETDPLTHLANRRLFQSHVDAGVKRWTSSGRAYYFAMLDLDHFKRVNDEFGHLYGDEILVHFANVMRATFRSGDQLYRFGGEEFVVIFGVEPPEHGGEGTLERFRRAVESYDFPGVGKVTVSIGFARVVDSSTPAATLIDRADEALYYAKENGRNKVCGWDSLKAAGLLKPRPAVGDVTLF
jgi:diguanylate cyclase (GGDEF)-like protein